jgi:hypothetical protein
MSEIRKKIATHPDAGLHAIRHTFPTEAGKYTDPFTLQYVAKHDNIETTMRYVHPQANTVQSCLADWADPVLDNGEARSERSVQHPVQDRKGCSGKCHKWLSK